MSKSTKEAPVKTVLRRTYGSQWAKARINFPFKQGSANFQPSLLKLYENKSGVVDPNASDEFGNPVVVRSIYSTNDQKEIAWLDSVTGQKPALKPDFTPGEDFPRPKASAIDSTVFILSSKLEEVE